MVKMRTRELLVKPKNPHSLGMIEPIAAGTNVSDDYRIDSAIDADRANIFYKAVDLHLDIPVLIREFIPQNALRRADDGSLVIEADDAGRETTEGTERFIREARALVRFHHPNIIRGHRVFEANGTAYIVLDFEKATSLRAWLDNLGRPPTQTELDKIVGRLLEALSVVHDGGVLHRDIRPENILIRPDLSPVLTGFAHATIANAQQTTSNATVLDETEFQAPENASSHGAAAPTLSSDIYSLAATLYNAVTGTIPPAGTSRLLNDELVPVAEVMTKNYRDSFLAVIDASLALPPGERPQDVSSWLKIDTPIHPALASSVTQMAAPIVHSAEGGVAPTNHSVGTRYATRIVSFLETLPDPGEYASALFEKCYLPVAIICAFTGVSLFGAGWSIAISAILQVLAILLLTAGGCLELYRFNFDLRRNQAIDIPARASKVTAKSAILGATILGILAMSPIFASQHFPSDPNAPLQMLSFIIGLPATSLLVVALSTTAITGIGRWIFGIINVLVIVFCLAILALYIYVLAVQYTGNFDAVPLANTYLFILAPTCVAALCGFILLSRLNAIRSHRRAAGRN